MSHRLVISLEPEAIPGDVQRALAALGLWTRPLTSSGSRATVLRSELHSRPANPQRVAEVPGVADVFAEPSGHPRVDEQSGRTIQCGEVAIGGGAPTVLFAGPCGAESRDQVFAAAETAARAGARVLRGGAFKPRTSPYSFQGHGAGALEWLSEAAKTHGLALCTEVLSPEAVAVVATHADILQIGSRNMQNYALLEAVGAAGVPVLLKRAMSSDIQTWLLAGEHLMKAGASAVIFCERGITGIDGHTRNLLDLGAVAVLSHQYGQPVVVDPSHALGRTDLLVPMARAALAAGAAGLMVETHPDPCAARSDGPQALESSAMLDFSRQVLPKTARPSRLNTPSSIEHDGPPALRPALTTAAF